MSREMDKGLARMYQNCAQWEQLLNMLTSLPKEEQNPIMIRKVELLLENDRTTVDCIENGKPFIASWYANVPEIPAAMDIHCVSPVDNVLQHLYDNELKDLEDCDKMGIPEDICSLIRLATYNIRSGLLPKPTAMIAMMQPCDGQQALHESAHQLEGWKDVPIFGLDSTRCQGQDKFRFYAEEIKSMIAFLEDVTGRKMDYDKLREVIEETNRQYGIWRDYNELRRAVPCPGPSMQGAADFFPLTQNLKSGLPAATEVLQMIYDETKQRFLEGKGAVENERIRVLWPENGCVWDRELGSWLAEEWGANIIMDFQSNAPYTDIDTSTVDSMLQGLARRSMSEVMMIRQGGPVEVVIDDMTRMIQDYSIDCVIYPGHMGHKDQSGYIGFLRQAARDMEVPFLSFTSSMFDPRYTPFEEVKKKISDFFRAYDLG